MHSTSVRRNIVFVVNPSRRSSPNVDIAMALIAVSALGFLRFPYCYFSFWVVKLNVFVGERCKKQDDQLHICNFNYIVETSLVKVTRPSISRTLTIPFTATFEELHEALQIAFSWHSTTNYEFCFGKCPKILVASSERIATLALIEEEKANFDDFKDGSSTYIAEAMRNTFADRRIMGYSSDASSQLVHCVKIRAAPRSLYSEDIRCIGGIGHPFADGFDLDEWEELKKAYDTREPTP
jgi:hypothetical protein